MSAPQFTPGPWKTGVWEGCVSGRDQHFGKHAAVFAPSGDMICPAGLPDDPENIPNAHLIAAAPELYEALEEAICLIPASQQTALEKFNAALAKARGATPIQEDAGTSPKSAGDR